MRRTVYGVGDPCRQPSTRAQRHSANDALQPPQRPSAPIVRSFAPETGPAYSGTLSPAPFHGMSETSAMSVSVALSCHNRTDTAPCQLATVASMPLALVPSRDASPCLLRSVA